MSKKKVKVANSLDRALGNLKEIHEERGNEARAAELKAEDDRKRAEEAAVRQAREEEEAKIRGKREEELGAEKGRVLSAQEARTREEAAAAAERERIAAALEAERAHKEAELESEERRRTFPPWAIAGAAILVVAVLGLVAFGVYQSQRTEKVEDEAKAAIQRAAELQTKRDDVAKRLAAATTRLGEAKDESARKKAQDELDAIEIERKRLDDEKARHDAAEREARLRNCQKAREQVAAERRGPVHVSETDTSTALGGLPEGKETKAEKLVRAYCDH